MSRVASSTISYKSEAQKQNFLKHAKKRGFSTFSGYVKYIIYQDIKNNSSN